MSTIHGHHMALYPKMVPYQSEATNAFTPNFQKYRLFSRPQNLLHRAERETTDMGTNRASVLSCTSSEGSFLFTSLACQLQLKMSLSSPTHTTSDSYQQQKSNPNPNLFPYLKIIVSVYTSPLLFSPPFEKSN
jgi:hypothetical protein